MLWWNGYTEVVFFLLYRRMFWSISLALDITAGSFKAMGQRRTLLPICSSCIQQYGSWDLLKDLQEKNSSYISSSAAMKPPRSILKTCLMSSISNRGFPIFFSLFSKDLHFIYLRHLEERLSSSVLRKVTNYIPFSVIG